VFLVFTTWSILSYLNLFVILFCIMECQRNTTSFTDIVDLLILSLQLAWQEINPISLLLRLLHLLHFEFQPIPASSCWSVIRNVLGTIMFFKVSYKCYVSNITFQNNCKVLGIRINIKKGMCFCDRLCGLVFDCRHYRIFWEVVGLERGPLSLVRIIEELLQGKSGSGLENRD
jgi:hypothetical protein